MNRTWIRFLLFAGWFSATVWQACALQLTRAGPADMQMRRVWADAPDNSGNPSADGRLLSFVDWETGDVAVRDLFSGRSRRLTHKPSWNRSPEYAEWPKVSPDGKKVVYSWVAPDYSHELRVVDTDPASKLGPRIVLHNPDLHYIIPWAWSPDGKSVVALLSRGDDTNQLAWISIADGSLRPLKSIEWLSPTNVSVSSDGRFLVYDLNQAPNQAERDIFIMAADGSAESRLVQHESDDYAPVWAPDGHAVLFASNRTGAVGLWSVPVADGRATGPAELVKGDLGQVLPLGITRDGCLFYAEHRGMDDIYGVELDPVSGHVRGSPTRLIERFIGRNSAPVWSPDGKQIVFATERDGVGNLFRKASNNAGTEEPLFKSNEPKIPSDWSRDGRFLLFQSVGPGAGPDIWYLPMTSANGVPAQEFASLRSWG